MHVLLQICQSDYKKDLLEWIDADDLPDWLGGRSKGTLLDDVGPWSDPGVLRRIEGQSAVAAKALKRLGSAAPAVSATEGQIVLLDELADGYHSPRWVRARAAVANTTKPQCWDTCSVQRMPRFFSALLLYVETATSNAGRVRMHTGCCEPSDLAPRLKCPLCFAVG